MLEKQLKNIIKEVPDFPKPGISFKDISPLLAHPELSAQIISSIAESFGHLNVEYVAGIESRGFLYGLGLAQHLSVPFVPIRKAGKLPRDTFSVSYDLEYGSATLELHKEDVKAGANVLIHDDLLATGGTSIAAAKLLEQASAKVIGFSYLIELDFLNASQKLTPIAEVNSLVHY